MKKGGSTVQEETESGERVKERKGDDGQMKKEQQLSHARIAQHRLGQ